MIQIKLWFLCLLFLASITENSLVYGSSVLSRRIAKRPDPLRKLKPYGGDYDLRDKHYWASAAFTGIHGYAVAGIWFIAGFIFAVLAVIKSSGETSPAGENNISSKLIIFWLIVVSTISAIVATSVILAADQSSLKKANKLQETIFGAGDNITQTIGTVKAILLQMYTVLCPVNQEACQLLDLLGNHLRKLSSDIYEFIKTTRKYSHRAIQTLYVLNLVAMSVNLGLLVAGTVLLTKQYRPGIVVLIFSCWIITTLSWLLTGADFFLYNFIMDTCSALKDFDQDPDNNTLTEMLSCPKPTVSHKILHDIGFSVHTLIAEINSKIKQIIGNNEYVLQICDPFSATPDYTYSPENCATNSILIEKLPSILHEFICDEVDITAKCRDEGRILPKPTGAVFLSYSEAILGLINSYPDLTNLMECSSVKEAASHIVRRQCRRIELSARVLWVSILCLSIDMVVVVLLWAYKIYKFL